MKRDEILSTAARCVCTDREESYGDPAVNFEAVAQMWAVYLKARCVSPGADVDIRPEDVAAMMCLLKIGRVATGDCKMDNWVDIAGYAALGGEIDWQEGAGLE